MHGIMRSGGPHLWIVEFPENGDYREMEAAFLELEAPPGESRDAEKILGRGDNLN